MPAMNLPTITVLPVNCVRGTIVCPGDKSVSHRYAMLAALSEGQTILENFAPGADCATTLQLPVQNFRGWSVLQIMQPA